MSWNIAKPGDQINGPVSVTGNLTVDTNTLVVDAANNRVGIGTATPVAALQSATNIVASNHDFTASFVAPTVGLMAANDSGSAWIRIATYNSNATHDPYLNFLTSGGQNWSIGIDNSASDSLKFAMANGFNGTNEFLTLDASGRLGIGTASPAASLQVGTRSTSAVSNNSAILTAGGASASAGTTVAATFANTVAAAVGNEAQITFTPAGNYSATGAIGTAITSTANGESALKFYTYNNSVTGLTERLRIGSNGVCTWSNVGSVSGTALTLDTNGYLYTAANGRIGVGVVPLFDLHVERAGQAELRLKNTSGSGLAAISLIGGSQTNPWYIYTDASRNFIFQDSTTERLRISSTGQALFSINGTASAPTIANADNPDTGLYWPNDNDTLALAVGGSDAVYIDSSRNVGIGTHPGYKLDIRDNSTGLLARLSSTSTGGCSMQFVSTSTNGRTYRIGSNYVSGAGEFSIYDDTAGAERLRIKSTGQLNFTGLSADPAGAAAGDVYYNSSTNKLRCYNGTTWNDLF